MEIRGHKKNERKYSGGGPRPDHNDAKRREAQERQAGWSSLSPQQQLASLNSGRTADGLSRNPGESKRQRDRIDASIQEASRPKAKTKSDKKEERIAEVRQPRSSIQQTAPRPKWAEGNEKK